jgi:hypothetical protein
MLFEEGSGCFGGTGFSDVVTQSRKGSPHAVASGFLVVNNHQSQRVFSHFQISLGPCGPKLLAHRVPQVSTDYLRVRLADTTRMIASPDGPILSVPTITGSPSFILMSVARPVCS